MNQLLEDDKSYKKHIGLCDDIFLTVVEFIYRSRRYGWSDNVESVSNMEVGLNDSITLDVFLSWCELMYEAVDYNVISLLLDSKCDYLISAHNLSENEIIRLKTMRKLIDFSALIDFEQTDGVIKKILDFSNAMVTSEVFDKCLNYYSICSRGEE